MGRVALHLMRAVEAQTLFLTFPQQAFVKIGASSKYWNEGALAFLGGGKKNAPCCTIDVIVRSHVLR